MATNLENLTVKVSVESDGAVKAFDTIGNSAKKLNLTFDSLASNTIALNQAFELASKGISLITGSFGALVKQFAIAEQAQLKLEKALSLAGNRVLNSASAWDAYADAVEKATGEDADAIKQLVARSIQIGRSEEQTKKLIDASRQLSFVTGGNLTEAYSMLENTFKGVTRGVDIYDRSITGLTAEQLQNGAAVDSILKKYKDLKQVESTALSIKLFTIALDDLKEEIGAGIVNATNLTGTLNTLKGMVASITGVMKSIDFSSLSQGIAGFSTILVGLATVTMPAFRAQLLGVAVAAKGIVAAFAPVALIATSIVTVGIAVELLARNMTRLPQVATLVWNSFLEAFSMIGVAVDKLRIKLFDVLGMKGQKAEAEKSLAEIYKSIEKYSNKAEEAASELDLGFTGKIAVEAKKAFDSIGKSFAVTGDTLKKTGKESIKETVLDTEELKRIQEESKKAGEAFVALKDQLQKLKDVGAQLSLDIKMPGASEAEKAYQAGLLQLETEKQIALQNGASIKAVDEITAKKIEELQINKQLAEGAKVVNDIYQQQQKALETQKTVINSLYEQNAATSEELLRIGMTSEQIRKRELQVELDKINAKREELKLAGVLSAEAEHQLKLAESLATQKAQSKEQGGATQAAQGVDMAIGASSPIGMFMGAAEGIVGAVQKLIDFIPNILNGIAKIFSSLADLPEMIFKAIMNVIASLGKLIGKLIPDLFKYLPKIILELINALFKTIPDAIVKLLEALPEIITVFIGELPRIIEAFIIGFVKAIPKLIIALAKAMPKIMVALAQAVPILIEAILTMLWDGLKEIWNSITGMGKSVVKSITSGVTEGITAATQAVTGIGDQLFKVMEDMPSVSQAKDQALALIDSAQKAGRSIWESLVKAIRQAWEWLKSIGLRIWDGMVSGVKSMWEWIKSIGSAVWEGMKAGVAIIWDTMKSIGSAVWEGLKNSVSIIWDTIKSIGGVLWQGVVDSVSIIWNTIKNFGKLIWEGLAELFSGNGGEAMKKFAEAGKAIWNGMVELFNKSVEMFGKIGGFIWDGLKRALAGAGSMFTSIGTAIWDGLAAGFKAAGNFIGKLFELPKSAWGKGTIEKWAGIDIPFLQFAQGGVVPGVAKKEGDSKDNDTVPALLSPGEIVLPRSVVKNSSYQKVIEKMMKGEQLQQFAGGYLGKAWEGTKSVAGKVASGVQGVGDWISNAWNSLSGELKAVWNFLKDTGASLKLEDFLKNPIKAGMAALEKIMDKYIEPRIKGVLESLMKGFNQGGFVGGMGFGDSVPAMLTPGEFVMNRQAVENIGVGTLERMNKGVMPQGSTTNVSVNLTVNTEQPIDERFIKTKLVPVLLDEVKRESLRGAFVLSGRGIK